MIYGAGGAIGGAVARAFAREGARLSSPAATWRRSRRSPRTSSSAGGSAEAAAVDALDEQAIDDHLQSVIDKAGRVDISFNAIGVPDANILGVPLVDLDVDRFSLPIAAYTTSYFLTARLAARRMIPNRSGVIMTVTALHSRTGIPLVGRLRPGDGRQGIAHARALRRARAARHPRRRPPAAGHAGDPHDRRRFEARAAVLGMTWEQWQELLASRTHPRRLMTLAEMANMAVFMASDRASGMTGTTVNLTMGSLDD